MNDLRKMMTYEQHAQENQWADQIKYHAARAIWHKRRATVPSGKYSWAIWFEKKYGEPYLEYVERIKKQKKREP